MYAIRSYYGRWVTVEFTGQVMGNLPWEFRPLQKKIRLHPGDTAVIKYYARNLANDTIVGRAVPSVAPRITSYNVCYTKLLRTKNSVEGNQCVAETEHGDRQ